MYDDICVYFIPPLFTIPACVIGRVFGAVVVAVAPQ